MSQSLHDVLGMRLEDALALYRARGMEPPVLMTRAPRDQRSGGTLRVIRVRENELTVSAFRDAPPDQ